jgi:hypothetical protein
VELYSRNNGVLFLDCGSTDSEGKRQTAQMKVSSINWDSSKWYFVAASWQTGQTPVLYVRELSSEGPAASPAAAKAELSKGDKFVEKIPEGHNDYPFVRPFAIGARWTDTGGAQGTFDGAGARIAWFRLDNVYSSDKDIATVFESLGAK